MENQTTNPSIICAVDYRGWTFHQIASQMVHQLGNEFEFNILLAEEMRYQQADLLVCFPWKHLLQVVSENKFLKKIVCIYDSVTWCRADIDEHMFKIAISEADGIVVANQYIADQIRYRGFDSKPIYICEDGVCSDLFSVQPLPKLFSVGWTGNSRAGYSSIKGLEIIKEACERTKTQLLINDIANGGGIPLEAMPAFYAQIAAYICMSEAEGTPNPPLEAMASGRPVISTRVGIMGRLINHGINGYFCDRDVNALAAAILKLKEQDILRMGTAARVTAEAHHWKFKMLYWRSAIRGILG